MRKFLIANSERFTGNVEAVYNAAGQLLKIDFINAVIDPETLKQLKAAIPVNLNKLSNSFGEKTTIVESDVVISFEMFWTAYDKKINKSRCLPLWNKLSNADMVNAYYGIQAYNKFLDETEWRSKADPEKYLRSRYWENEYK